MTDADKTIPIVVGVTAHRAIREQDREPIRRAVKDELRRLQALCPNSPLLMLNSLAEGGDLLCAAAAEELGIALVGALPRPREDYETDFGDAAKRDFAHQCGRARELFVAPPTETVPPEGANRDFEFRQAGIYVAAHCHILLALWDGGPGTSAACGTAEIVDFALNGDYDPATGYTPRSSSNEAVIHIFTPRGTHTEEAAGTVHMLGNWEALTDVLRKTDDYNRHAVGAAMETDSRIPTDGGGDKALLRMEAVGRTAGQLSMQYARRYRLVLVLLAVASALLTFSFLMYDEAQAIWMILVCGAMLLAAWGCQRYAVHSDCHRRYLEYRALAESLRVQTYLRYAGSRVEAARLFSWTQQEDTGWIVDALCALTIGDVPKVKNEIRECWVLEQRDYHRAAAKKSGVKLNTSTRTVQAALLLSVVLYLAAVGFELLCGGLSLRPRFQVTDVEQYRTLLKILLGTIAAISLFVANYYGRLSLPRVFTDHEKMERFYDKMLDQLQKRGQTEELLTLLAREELIENGNWISYQRDNKPDMSI